MNITKEAIIATIITLIIAAALYQLIAGTYDWSRVFAQAWDYAVLALCLHFVQDRK